MKAILGNNVPRRPPEIKGGAILGVWQEYLWNPPAFLEKAARDCGDVARFRLVHHHAYLLNHWIKEVLVTNQANFTKSRMLERLFSKPMGQAYPLLTNGNERYDSGAAGGPVRAG